MNAITASLRRFLHSEDGPSVVEYSVMIALIMAVVVGAVSSVGSATNTTFITMVGAVNPEAAEDEEGGRRGFCP